MIMKNKDEALTRQCEEWLTDEISDGYNSQRNVLTRLTTPL